MKIIYDVGANNGSDLPYYLHKADLVVAIEANPRLTDIIKRRFRTEIASGRLIVESCVVTAAGNEASVPFYLHKRAHVQSQFPRPSDARMEHFDEIQLPSKNLINIISNYGEPHYIKIDVERYDRILVKDLLEHGVFPAYLSAESHEIDVFATLVALGGYKAFKLVDGNTVPQIYQNHKINTLGGMTEYSFPHHSAGPFGNDINGPWLTAWSFCKVLARAGLGWKDIHVSKIDKPER